MACVSKNVIGKIKLFKFQVWPTSFDTIVTLVCSNVFIGADWCYLDLSPATWTADFHDNHEQVSVQTRNPTLVYTSWPLSRLFSTPWAALNYWIKIRLTLLIPDYTRSLQFSYLRRAVRAGGSLTSHWHAIARLQKLQIVQIRARDGELCDYHYRLGWDIFIALGRRRSVNIIKTPHCSISRADSVGAEATFHLSRPTAAEADTKSGRRGRDLGPGTLEPTCVQRPPGSRWSRVSHRTNNLLSPCSLPAPLWYFAKQWHESNEPWNRLYYAPRSVLHTRSTCTLLGAYISENRPAPVCIQLWTAHDLPHCFHWCSKYGSM